MPKVSVDIRKGRTSAEKKALMDAIHQALVAAIKIPEHDRLQVLHEHEEGSFYIPGGNKDNFVNIDIIMYPGRTKDAKRNLYKFLAENLEELGVNRSDLMVTLHEPVIENWGLNGLPGDEQV